MFGVVYVFYGVPCAVSQMFGVVYCGEVVKSRAAVVCSKSGLMLKARFLPDAFYDFIVRLAPNTIKDRPPLPNLHERPRDAIHAISHAMHALNMQAISDALLAEPGPNDRSIRNACA